MKQNEMPLNRLIQKLLLMTADELDARFGPHPNVPKDRVKEIAREVTDKFVTNPDQKLYDTLNQQIDAAFGGR